MFTTKKRKNYMTFIYSAIIVVLCLLIVAIAWPNKADNVPAAQTGAADSTQNKPDTEENIKEKDYNPGEKNNISDTFATYYLVKSVDGKVKVFFVNESGEPLELETTEIVYDLLSTADQKLFDEGCKVESQEELAVLLQDFES
ncbi:MAG: hypothetical protein PUD12_02425 [Firmicutes bacterium]|nr:hypothetical protein [Bacillota bacterium]